MGNRGRCRKTCKVRGETQGAPPPRTLGFPSAKRPFVLPKLLRQLLASCPVTARSGPLPSRDGFRGLERVPGPGCQGRADDKAPLGRCKRGRGAAKHPAGASLPAGADVPSDPARPRCRSQGSRSNPRSAQNCLEVYGRWSYAWKFWRAPRVSHLVPKRDPRALSRGCGAHRYRAGGRGGVAKPRTRELRLRGGFAGYPGRQRDARAGMELAMSVWGGGAGLVPVPTRAGAMRGGRRRRPRRGSAPCPGAGSPVCPPRATLPGRNSRPGCS